ncbi:MAG TPA: CPBP family intramembrane glutamic endopeptidase [Luteolibacter sp.]|nr:CPBP family intramembrane glutamic endopeptidase [Luteolibacter sp.]
MAALLFVWSWDLYNDRYGETPVPSDLAERALTYLDRSLRLEEEAAVQPEIIRQTLFGSGYDEVLEEAKDALESLSDEDTPDEAVLRSFAVTCAESGTPLDDLSGLDDGSIAILSGEQPTGKQIDELASRLGDRTTSNWWDAKLAEKALLTVDNPALSRALAFHQKQSRHLFRTQLVCSAVNWLVLVVGLFFIPHAFRVIRRGWTGASLHRPTRYASRWEPTLVIALLLAGDLLANYGIDEVYYLADGLHYDLGIAFPFNVFMDSLWRIAAPVIALVVLFRKPSHAVRSLGLDKKPDWKLILAVFSVVSWSAYGFNIAIEPWMDFDPTGGIDPMESGWGGLFYGLLSACVLAPVFEEIFYRGILFRGLLLKFGFWLSATIATLAFVLAHSYDFFGLVTIGIFGFAMTVVYRTTGSLTTAIVLHCLYNFTITLPDWLLYHAP